MIESNSAIALETKQALRKTFNNRVWRQLLTEAGNAVGAHYGVKLDVISPFGFELSENKAFLSNSLRRFYVYIGVTENTFDKEKTAEITAHFKALLFKALTSVEAILLDDIVIVVENEQLKKLRDEFYVCKDTDKLIDIQLRLIKEGDMLDDYADYVMTALTGLYYEKGEGKNFRINKIGRWRLYQLYIMQEYLFGYLVPITADEQEIYRSIPKILSNRIHLFFTPGEIMAPPSEQENDIINTLIKPRIEKIYQAVIFFGKNEKKTIQSKVYHDPDTLDLRLDTSLYEEAVKKIRTSYLNFE